MIRQAEFADRIAMVRMARAFVQASGLPLPFNAAWAESSAKGWIADPDKLALVLDVDGVKGMLCAAWVQSPLAPVRVACEQVFWVDPVARSFKRAVEMLAAYEAWAREQGCEYAGLASLDSKHVGLLYERRGFSASETHYLKVL